MGNGLTESASSRKLLSIRTLTVEIQPVVMDSLDLEENGKSRLIANRGSFRSVSKRFMQDCIMVMIFSSRLLEGRL